MPSRKNRNSTRRNRHLRKRHHRGGMSPVGDNSMALAMKNSMAQGSQFLNMHRAQHGGAAAYPSAVMGSTLPSDLIASSRTAPLDAAIAATRGMQDGGRRALLKKARKTRKARKSRKSRKARKSRKSRKARKHRGGAHMGSPVSANSMLLAPGQESKAALHADWAAARDPAAFAPKA